jgi:hypothetical protein
MNRMSPGRDICTSCETARCSSQDNDVSPLMVRCSNTGCEGGASCCCDLRQCGIRRTFMLAPVGSGSRSSVITVMFCVTACTKGLDRVDHATVHPHVQSQYASNCRKLCGCPSYLRIKLVGIHQHLVHSPHVVDAAMQSVVCAGIVAAKQRCASSHVECLAAKDQVAGP